MTDPWQLANAEANRRAVSAGNLSNNTMETLTRMMMAKGRQEDPNAELVRLLLSNPDRIAEVLGGQNVAGLANRLLGGNALDPGYAAQADANRLGKGQAELFETNAGGVNKLGSVGQMPPPAYMEKLFGTTLRPYISPEAQLKASTDRAVAATRAAGEGGTTTTDTMFINPVTGEGMGVVQRAVKTKGAIPPAPRSDAAVPAPAASTKPPQAKIDPAQENLKAERFLGPGSKFVGTQRGKDGKDMKYFQDATGKLYFLPMDE